MNRRQILLNALSTIAQLIGNGALLFFLYRFLIREVGIERLGVWSLLLATTSLVTLANQGLSMSIVKFVAKYAARESPADVSLLVQTALITAGAILAVLSIGLYPGARWALSFVLPAARLAEGLAILPFALVSLWLNVLGTIAQAGLAGHELITLCNYIEFGGAVSYLALAFVFVPRYGLVGLAAAQAAQAALGLAAAWFLLRRCVPGLPWLPRHWSRLRFREMLGYGAHFQWITLCQSVREPVTKALLAKFAGLSYTGFYDMASRLVVNLRELIVQANQVLVPTISSLSEGGRDVIDRIYRDSYRTVFFLAVPSFAVLAMASPFISVLWIGRYEPVFVRFVGLLAVGWLFNVLCNPAYVVDLGTGSLRWVSIGCAVTAVLNAGLGIIAGKVAGGTAIVAAGVLSLIAGYLIILVAYHRQRHESFGVLLPHESRTILALSVASALVLLPLLYSGERLALSPYVFAFAAAVLAASIAVPAWTHPVRRRLFQWLTAGISS
ncbi:MAG TPA: lipopolysaccharide biosynthesis protein [Candidatus Aquilonibacter sp.]|nr:lipopolysaccharide biosynthesis protein [Candidatus Aquilonibacter sp.]